MTFEVITCQLTSLSSPTDRQTNRHDEIIIRMIRTLGMIDARLHFVRVFLFFKKNAALRLFSGRLELFYCVCTELVLL